MVYIEAACATDSIRKNPEQAREWRQRATALTKPRSLEPVDAEIPIARGRFLAALQHLAAAQAYLDKCGSDSGLARIARELWTESGSHCPASLSGVSPKRGV